MPPGFHIAWGPIRWFLERHDFAAVTMPWRRVYMLQQYAHRTDIIAHERIHLEQIDRYGPARFTILYLWWLLRFGYEGNPLEVEAYAKAPLME